ncbi:unnamed protein product [Calypogeia fissa]
MTTPVGGAKSAIRGAVGAKAKPLPKKIIVKAKPLQPNPRQILGIRVKPPQKDKPEVAEPSPDQQPHPPSPTEADVQVALDPLPLFNWREAQGPVRSNVPARGSSRHPKRRPLRGLTLSPSIQEIRRIIRNTFER